MGSKDIGVMSDDGRFEDADVIVLAVPAPGTDLTEISVTVMPTDEDPRRPENRFDGGK